jgi:phage tail tape-measure protein
MAKYSASGAASGAISGASIGSTFGPWGTAAGSVIGGLGGLFGSKKKKKKPGTISTLDPKQQQLYNDYVNGIRGEGSLGNLYNYDAESANQNFDKNVSRPAYRNFQENIVPTITGQFRKDNLGQSSYAGQALSRAGRDVQENLDAQRSNMIFNGQQQAQNSKQNAITGVLGMSNFANTKPKAPTPSGIDQILGSIAPQAGEWFADYLKSVGKGSASAPAA